MENNYLINQLNEERNLNIVLLSHNSHWPELQIPTSHFNNCKVSVFGSSTSYMTLKNNTLKNADLIIYYSNEYYSEHELNTLKNIAFEISNNENKRVSIGYSYFIPHEQRKYENISQQIKIISFKDNEEYNEETYLEEYFSTKDLTELTLATADYLDIEKQKKKEKKHNFLINN